MSSLAAWASSVPSTVVSKVRRLLGETVAGVLVERAVHAHAVAPGDAVGVRLRAPGLDALGLAAAQRIAPDELLDALGAHLQGENVIDPKEVEIRDRVGDRRRYAMEERVGRWEERCGARHRGHRRYRHRGRGRRLRQSCACRPRSGPPMDMAAPASQ